MIKEKNYNLKNHNTFHLESVVENFYIPENETELIEVINKLNEKKEKYYILSGGSNVLLKDNMKYDNIIYMQKVDVTKKMLDSESGKFYIGASNRIQEIIKYVNEKGYGGFEELYCLPAFFGGIIYMNAGIGSRKKPLFNISSFIEKVRVLNIRTGKVEWLYKNECEFEYRKSIFFNNQHIILGAEIILNKQEKEISNQRINKRIDFCKKNQEWGKGCFGTCFSKASPRILKIAKLLKPKAGDIHFGEKNSNWLVNNGNGTYKETQKLIKFCYFLHKLFLKEIELEVRIFE